MAFGAIMALLSAAPALAGEGVKVDHLGVNNALVRVTSPGAYLLLPVEEDCGDATVQLLVDGVLTKTFYVRLAKNKVDYLVPLPISEYRGKEVMLNVTPHHGSTTVDHSKKDLCWDAFTVSDSFDTSNREKYRPAYHHTPLYGWMNDPNGMVYRDGTWHLYYQYNPFGSKWQNMTWGHSTSTDLLHWVHQPLAIEPDALGSIFSGSCALDPGNTAGFGSDAILAMYTSAGASQVQSLAHSKDGGITFEKYAGNPTLPFESEARDPNMFWNSEINQWNLILAHPLEHEMLIFTSPDMKNWTLQSTFGHGLGSQDGVWECPDLFPLTVEGTGEKKWVLLCNINPGGPFGGSATQYFIGDFDGKTFIPDLDASGKVPIKWMDFGKDHYATVSWSDAPAGRRTVIGWMSNWEYADAVPTMQYRSANTLPRDLGLFRAPDGELYLASRPSPETNQLRAGVTKRVKSLSAGTKGKSYAIPALCEIDFEIEPRDAKEITVTLSNARGEKAVTIYDPARGVFSFDRTQSGQVEFSRNFPAVTTAPAFSPDGTLHLRIFVDRSSVEVFEAAGRAVMTNLVFPNSPYTTLTFQTQKGSAQIKNLKIYSLNEN